MIGRLPIGLRRCGTPFDRSFRPRMTNRSRRRPDIRRFARYYVSITMNRYSAFGFNARRFNATRFRRCGFVDLLKSLAVTISPCAHQVSPTNLYGCTF
jgi:hypothetical protein